MRGIVALLIAATVVACNDETVEDVPQDVCISGKRWIGGRRGSEEMYPGRDCVGCHLENDGPQLMAGGTVYGFSEGKDSSYIIPVLGKPQSVDCFGLEGVTVTLTSKTDLEVFTTVTNRAGNFFFEGRPSELAKPFVASLSYLAPATADRPEQLATPSMNTTPSYGGCARCHSPTAVASPNPTFPPPPDLVFPAGDYIDLRLPIAEFIEGSTASAGAPDDAAHAASVAEIQDFVDDTASH
jgi:cytochrome c553